MQTAAPIQFSLKDLLWLVTGIGIWLGLFHNLGTLGIIFTSPLLGGWFIFIGTLFRLRSLTMLGALLFFAGPLILGVIAALFDTW